MAKLGKWTRRSFIAGGVLVGGVLIVGVGIRRGDRRDEVLDLTNNPEGQLLNLWVKIDQQGKITAIIPHSEMGQGAQTVLTQMLADELDANWDDVSFIEAPVDDEYSNGALVKGYLMGNKEIPSLLVPTVNGIFHQLSDSMTQQITGGSLSIRTTGVYGMRVAGASAREMLVKAAASKWKVAEESLQTSNSQVIHSSSNRSISYAELVVDAAKFTPSQQPTLKKTSDFSLMGKNLPRHDLPSKVMGTAQFGIDAIVPNMQYAAIKAAPVFGAKVKSYDDSTIKSRPEISNVVNLDNALAVVASSYWHAQQALDSMPIKWTETENSNVNSQQLYQQFNDDLTKAYESGDSSSDVKQGNTKKALANANQTIEATYQVPFLAHACMEPMNATVAFSGDQCDVWVGSQNPLGFKYKVAEALDISDKNVTIHQHLMGGGFGRRASADFVIQAAKIAKATALPIKLIWSRPEDIQQDLYRPSVVSQFRAGMDDNGEVTAWDNIYHEKHEPVEAPIIPYDIATQHIHYIESPTHIPFGAWRSVDHSLHGFFTEVFVDELAVATSSDPYQFRKKLLVDQPRYVKLLDTVAQQTKWGTSLGANRGRGIAIHKSFGTIVAQVVEVTFSAGKINVDRVICAVDPGFAVSPDGLKAQMESGIIYGLSAARYGEITIENGAVQQNAFHDYPVIRMSDAPEIEVHIINSGETWGGAGEPGTPVVAPALINAIYQATGERIRSLPISNHEFST